MPPLPEIATTTVSKRPRRELSKTAGLQRKREMARPGFEPGTPRFSEGSDGLLASADLQDFYW
jgi:hypothetical protein